MLSTGFMPALDSVARYARTKGKVESIPTRFALILLYVIKGNEPTENPIADPTIARVYSHQRSVGKMKRKTMKEPIREAPVAIIELRMIVPRYMAGSI